MLSDQSSQELKLSPAKGSAAVFHSASISPPCELWQAFMHSCSTGPSEGSRNEALLPGALIRFVYLVEVWVGQQMQLPRLEAVLTFTFVENIRLEFPTRVFFCSRHCFTAYLTQCPELDKRKESARFFPSSHPVAEHPAHDSRALGPAQCFFFFCLVPVQKQMFRM